MLLSSGTKGQSEMEELIASLEARQRHENYARFGGAAPAFGGYQQGAALGRN
ncbi:MAG: hypothetical protein ACLSTT_03505 [Evtepia gabavorous]